jgi:hypothetical protein
MAESMAAGGGFFFGVAPTMTKFICIEREDGTNYYLRLSDIESIETRTGESLEGSAERKSGHPYRVKVLFKTRSRQEAEVSFGFGENRQINLKRLLRNWTICL